VFQDLKSNMVRKVSERNTYPPNRFAISMASSREKLDSSPVKTNERLRRQFKAPSGSVLEPGADGPASLAALAAAQLKKQFSHNPE
jgi:hypothetical protein